VRIDFSWMDRLSLRVPLALRGLPCVNVRRLDRTAMMVPLRAAAPARALLIERAPAGLSHA